MKRVLLLILCSVLCFSQSTVPMYTGFMAGSTADIYHGPIQSICTFSGSTATNPPCMANYVDSSLVINTLFYGYSGLPFSYNIPVLTGTICDVQFTAFEPNRTGVGQRVFVVEVVGRSTTIDLVALAGTKVPYIWTMPSVPVVDLYLHINFRPIVGNAVINSITWNCR